MPKTKVASEEVSVEVVGRVSADTGQSVNWGLMIALCVGAFVGMVDATIVAVALDPLSQHFLVPLSSAQETLSIYLVTVTAALPTIGRLGDRFGRRQIYLCGFAIFAIGSIFAALAVSFNMLLFARAVQALGGGILTASSLALIAQYSPKNRTGRRVASMVVTQAIAGLVGPPLGGLLVAIWGWQSVFWAGLPLATIGILLTMKYVPRAFEPVQMNLDIGGALALAIFLLAIGTAVSALAGPVPGNWPALIWFLIALGAGMTLLIVERIVKQPIIDSRFLGERSFRLAALATFLSTGTLMSCFALLPFWLEQAHKASAALAGVAFIPIGVGIAITSRQGGYRGDMGKTRSITVLGMIVAATGLLLSAIAAATVFWPLLVIGLFVLGCGNGLFSSPNTAAAISLAPKTVLGSAAGFLSTARNAGVVVGLGTTAAIYTAIVGQRGVRRADVATSMIFIFAAVICLIVAAIAAATFRTES